MGTNYYWRDKPCEKCGRYEVIHVGKSGFTFRGYPHVPLNDEHPDWGYRAESPVGFPVLSVKDWATVFERPGELWNEYGNRIDHPLGWLASIPRFEATGDRQRWLDEDIADGTGWLDPDGYRFYAREFS